MKDINLFAITPCAIARKLHPNAYADIFISANSKQTLQKQKQALQKQKQALRKQKQTLQKQKQVLHLTK